jgi:Domain of unknown function (DUF4331)
MKSKIKLIICVAAVGLIASGILYASDHMDSPTVTGQPSDITDLYVFEGQNPDNLVFVGNTQGFLTPAATASAKFDENTLIQFSIDNNGNNLEDLVVQCIYNAARNRMEFYGPVKPSQLGTVSKLEGPMMASVEVTPYGASPKISTENGITVFAGPRDDPFFFDLDQFKKIIAGTATSFNNPGADTFAGTNVLSVVVEIPKSMLGGAGKLNVWLTTRTKQVSK